MKKYLLAIGLVFVMCNLLMAQPKTTYKKIPKEKPEDTQRQDYRLRLIEQN